MRNVATFLGGLVALAVAIAVLGYVGIVVMFMMMGDF